MLPQTNAMLTEIFGTVAGVGGGAPSAETWDDPDEATETPETPDEGASKWEGEVDAYYRERRDRVLGGQGGADDRTLMREVIFANGDVPSELDEGDTIVVVRATGQEIRGRAKLVERRELASMPADVQTTRVTLESG